ncbi:MAG: hypothetical protein SF029_09565 [bacterium]|nr:hypothetical protein [bacterium]
MEPTTKNKTTSTQQSQQRKDKDQPNLTAQGHTSVILVINMRQFVAPQSQALFDSVRGSEIFSRVLREDWPRLLEKNNTFSRVNDDSDGTEAMSADEIGFMTGIFRQNMLDTYSSPDYRLNKNAVQFSKLLSENLQFKQLYQPIWNNWEIYIRPTMTGMFTIRVVRDYQKAQQVRNIVQHVIELQNSFDIHGALEVYQALDELRRSPTKEKPRDLQFKIDSVEALLRWLEVDPQQPPTLRYAPVQWQLALEVGRLFVRELGQTIFLNHNGNGHIHLTEPKRDTAQNAFDSYVIHHIDRLLTTLPKLAEKSAPHEHEDLASDAIPREPEKTTASRPTEREVTPRDLEGDGNGYDSIRQSLVNLLEGSMIRTIPVNERGDGTKKSAKANGSGKGVHASNAKREFPTHTKNYIAEVLDTDVSTWQDEMCILQSRAALVMPSRKSRYAELFIPTVPINTLTAKTNIRVTYSSYWQALERMIEFVVEVRLLAQQLERDSTDLLQKFVTTLRGMRESMLRDYLNIDQHREILTNLVNESANLSRLVSVAQSMSNPQVWSRAEYGADKAEHLVQEMKIDVLLENTERNVSSLTNLVNHVDELYLAGLSESNNRETFWLSLMMAALSLSVILFSLPSFWADINQLKPGSLEDVISQVFIPALNTLGGGIAPLIIVMSLVLTLTGGYRTMRLWMQQRSTRRKLIARRRAAKKALMTTAIPPLNANGHVEKAQITRLSRLRRIGRRRRDTEMKR